MLTLLPLKRGQTFGRRIVPIANHVIFAWHAKGREVYGKLTRSKYYDISSFSLDMLRWDIRICLQDPVVFMYNSFSCVIFMYCIFCHQSSFQVSFYKVKGHCCALTFTILQYVVNRWPLLVRLCYQCFHDNVNKILVR